MDGRDFLHEIDERGYIHQVTDREALASAMRAGPIAAYAGFDCTADSLHVGNLVSIMMLRRLQQHGHRPVVVIGGGTTRIGDPSGKDESRQLLTDAVIAANMAGVRRNFVPFLNFGEGPTGALMVDNHDWLGALGYIDLLREVGPHFSINRMLTMDSVKLRLEREQTLSFLEFNYMILQSYDFRELHRRYGVSLQMGGSDQWGNIVSGVDLVRRTDQATVFGLTTPLITTASGAKMGKTAKGAVWLSAHRLSPYDYWQFWRNTEDGDIGRFLALFTDLPMAEIARLAALGGAEINEAKKILATEATSLLHGRAVAEDAAETAKRVFEEGEAGGAIPVHLVSEAELAAGIPVFRLLAESGLATSNGEARRLIRGGGARLNDKVVTEETQTTHLAEMTKDGIKLSAGKKNHRLIKLGQS
jgi:tyrosyl-tRNA synthetase